MVYYPPPVLPPLVRGGVVHPFHIKKIQGQSETTSGKAISDLLKSTKTVVLGLKKVLVILFGSLVAHYDVDAIKSYEGRQDPTQVLSD